MIFFLPNISITGRRDRAGNKGWRFFLLVTNREYLVAKLPSGEFAVKWFEFKHTRV